MAEIVIMGELLVEIMRAEEDVQQQGWDIAHQSFQE